MLPATENRKCSNYGPAIWEKAIEITTKHRLPQRYLSIS
jgi:hypothetical protein